VAEIVKRWKSYTCFSADYLNELQACSCVCSLHRHSCCFRLASKLTSPSVVSVVWLQLSETHCLGQYMKARH